MARREIPPLQTEIDLQRLPDKRFAIFPSSPDEVIDGLVHQWDQAMSPDGPGTPFAIDRCRDQHHATTARGGLKDGRITGTKPQCDSGPALFIDRRLNVNKSSRQFEADPGIPLKGTNDRVAEILDFKFEGFFFFANFSFSKLFYGQFASRLI